MTPDEQIKAHILDELRWDPKVKAAEIGVIVKDGAVTLTGTVTSILTKRAAEHVAKRVKGVHAVADKINVKLVRGKSVNDSDIAKRIAHVLDWSLSTPDHNIVAEVSEGHVTLTGDVDWHYQCAKAARLIEEVRGVIDVVNEI